MDKKERYPNIFSRSFLIFFLIIQTNYIFSKDEYFFRKNDPKLCHLSLPKPMSPKKENLAKNLLNKKLYQEAIWYLQELHEKKKCKIY